MMYKHKITSSIFTQPIHTFLEFLFRFHVNSSNGYDAGTLVRNHEAQHGVDDWTSFLSVNLLSMIRKAFSNDSTGEAKGAPWRIRPRSGSFPIWQMASGLYGRSYSPLEKGIERNLDPCQLQFTLLSNDGRWDFCKVQTWFLFTIHEMQAVDCQEQIIAGDLYEKNA